VEHLQRILSASGYNACIIERRLPGEAAVRAANGSIADYHSNGSSSIVHTLQESVSSTGFASREQSGSRDMLPNGEDMCARPREVSSGEWLLLCFDYYKFAGRAIHIPLEDESDDTTLISTLKQNYSKARSFLKRVSSWTEVTAISFVKVSLWYTSVKCYRKVH
jgi:hypothetical protein